MTPFGQPPREVAVLLGARAATFELGIACQVFGLDRSAEGLPVYDFALCAARPGLVPTSSGFSIEVPHGLERLESADLVVLPAWPALEEPSPPALLEALRGAVERGARVLSICTGAHVLAEAGLLEGRRVATHWQYAPRLAERFPRVQVDSQVLYVEDGPIVSSAGAAAGIDAALHVVRSAHGSAVANALARRMVVPPHREGGQAQFVETPVPTPGSSSDAALAGVLAWVPEHLDQEISVESLARRAHLAPRTFARRFRALTGTTPHRWVLEQRLVLAERLLESTELPVEAVARRSGVGSPDTLRHHLAARRGVSPAAYRATFRAVHGPGS